MRMSHNEEEQVGRYEFVSGCQEGQELQSVLVFGKASSVVRDNDQSSG